MQDDLTILGSAEARGLASPPRSWFLQQSWCHTVFVNIPVNPGDIDSLLPATLEPELFDGKAWLSIVIFRCIGTRIRLLGNTQTIPNYTELNLRTYVRHHGNTGVHFLQLRTGSWLARIGARLLTFMPYRHGHTAFHADNEQHYRFDLPQQRVTMHLLPGALPAARPIDQWLSERYCSYQAAHNGNIYRYDVRHTPWNLKTVMVSKCQLDYRYLHLHLRTADIHSVMYSTGVDALLWLGVKR